MRGAHHLPLHQAVLVQCPLMLVKHALLMPLTQVLQGGEACSPTAAYPKGTQSLGALDTSDTAISHLKGKGTTRGEQRQPGVGLTLTGGEQSGPLRGLAFPVQTESRAGLRGGG